MLRDFFQVQWNDPCPGDWAETVKNDLRDVKIEKSLNDIKKMPKKRYEKLVKEKVEEYAFEMLQQSKKSHKKMSKIEYPEFLMQHYIKDNDIPTELKRLAFNYRTHMLNFQENFNSSNATNICKLCRKHDDSQDLIDECIYLKEKYKDLKDIKKLYTNNFELKDVRLLEKIMKEREDFQN